MAAALSLSVLACLAGPGDAKAAKLTFAVSLAPDSACASFTIGASADIARPGESLSS